MMEEFHWVRYTPLCEVINNNNIWDWNGKFNKGWNITMCLAIPGKVISINREETPMMGKVLFGGIEKQVCFDLLPEAVINDYVVVHVGFAISKMDEEEAAQVFAYLKEMDDINELEDGEPTQ